MKTKFSEKELATILYALDICNEVNQEERLGTAEKIKKRKKEINKAEDRVFKYLRELRLERDGVVGLRKR